MSVKENDSGYQERGPPVPDTEKTGEATSRTGSRTL